MKVTATNKHTGEVIELSADSLDQVVEAWRIASEYDKAATALKDQLKKLVPSFINERGMSEEVKGYMFRQSSIQRMNYDKAVMRNVFDEDTYDLLVMPNKPMVDKYLKEHLEDLGGGSTELRASMIEAGAPYQVIKLEKIKS